MPGLWVYKIYCFLAEKVFYLKISSKNEQVTYAEKVFCILHIFRTYFLNLGTKNQFLFLFFSEFDCRGSNLDSSPHSDSVFSYDRKLMTSSNL